LTNFLTLIVAAIAVYIAYQQWLTARAKLNLDLFERRLPIFDATLKAAIFAYNDEETKNEALQGMTNLYAEASFLFKPEVEAYMRELSETIGELKKHRRDPNPNDNEKNKRVVALTKQLEGAVRQGIRTKFSPYLNFGQWS
jgi:hypothetical protein